MVDSYEVEVPLKNASLLDSRGFIGGEWKNAKDGKAFPVYEPSSGRELRQCADFGRQDFIEAIDSAEVGFRVFSSGTTGRERGAMLRRWYELMMENLEDCEYPILRLLYMDLKY